MSVPGILASALAQHPLKKCGHPRLYRCCCAGDPCEEDGRMTHELDVVEFFNRSEQKFKRGVSFH